MPYKDPEKVLETQRKYGKKYRESHPNQWRERNWRLKYNLTVEGFTTMWERQNGECVICRRPLEMKAYGYAIDHDHKTGKVRGILCFRCNSVIAQLETVGIEPYTGYLGVM